MEERTETVTPVAVGRVAYGEPFVDGLAPVTWAGKTMTRM